MGSVEVITSVERRCHWSAAQKQAMVDEAEEPGNIISSDRILFTDLSPSL